MKLLRTQTGALAVEAALLVVLLVIAGFVVLKVKSTHPSTPSGVATSVTAKFKEVKTEADLTAADQQLSQENLDAQTPEESQLDTDLATF